MFCENEKVLSCIYDFPHRARDGLQAEHALFCSLLEKCLEERQLEVFSAEFERSERVAEALSIVKRAVAHLSQDVRFKGEFGCAILPLSDDLARGPVQPAAVDECHLLLVCLDKWQYGVKSCQGTATSPSATCNDYAVMDAGSIPSAVFGEAMSRMDAAISKMQIDNEKTHKTPAFVYEVLLAVVEALRTGGAGSVKSARGGTADVGRHTGSERRDTSWALVQQTFRELLQRLCAILQPEGSFIEAQTVFEITMAQMDAWHLQRQVKLLSASSTSQVLTATMTILQRTALDAAQLSQNGHHKAAKLIGRICGEAHLAITKADHDRALNDARINTFKPGRPTESLFCGPVPPKPQPTADGDNLQAARRRADFNLETLPLLPLPAKFTEVRQWLALKVPHRPSQLHALDLQHRVKTVERLVFTRIAESLPNAARQLEDESEAQALQDVFDTYCRDMLSILRSEDGQLLPRSHLHSHMSLLAFSMYCLVHAAASSVAPLVLQYGVALDWRRLRHLVLADRHAEAAARSVAIYLSEHTKPGSELFAFTDEECQGHATFQFALAFSKEHPEFTNLLRLEKNDANQRIDEHWNAVIDKKEEARRLRSEISEASQKQTEMGVAYRTAQEAAQQLHHLSGFHRSSEEYLSFRTAKAAKQAAFKAWSSQTNVVRQLEMQLVPVLKPPKVLIQPLPEEESSALQWLFFMYMDRHALHLAILSRISFAAQQVFVLPLSANIKQTMQGPKLGLSLTAHFNGKQRSYSLGASTGRVGNDTNLSLEGKGSVPDSVGPSSIDAYHFKKDGVWFPDGLSARFTWKGLPFLSDYGGASSNPFSPRATTEHLSSSYTESLDCPKLQAYMACPGAEEICKDRGNLGIANPGHRPAWLSKPGFEAFSTLRSFPYGQLRRLCTALSRRDLPLHVKPVKELIQAAIFTFGDIDVAGGDCRRKWRGEGTAEFLEVLRTLHEELKTIANELRDKIREQGSLQLLGEIAAYFTSFDPRFHEVARDVAAIAATFVKELEASASTYAASDETRSALNMMMAKREALKWTILSCHLPRAFSNEDASAAVAALAWIARDNIFQEDKQAQQASRSVMAFVRNSVSGRIDEIVAAALRNKAMISRAVGEILGKDCSAFAWQQRECSGHMTASFEAVSDDHLYSMNLMTGTVLLDGLPLGRLPNEVVQNSLYKSVFGGINFEVSATKEGVFTTLAAVSASDMSEMDHPGYSCKYEFFHEHGQLFITELENNGLGERLQLVPQSSLTGLSIKADRSLPVRLRELHSHWYNHDRQILLFRPRHFTGRPADFIAFAISIAERDGEMESAARGAVCEYSCRRIPIHLRGTHWRALIATYHNELKDELVRVEGCVITKMLSKFEQVQYIHHFRRLDQHAASQKEPLLSFELPRLNLEFELQRRNEVVSKEYDGYCLRHCQQLVTMRDRHMPLEGLTKDPVTYTLNGFTEYLILERRSCSASSRSKRAEVLVLVPAGTVRQTQDGKVSITTPPGAGASFKSHIYEVHPRFHDLRANNVPARLQLAALYAATSSLVAEPESGLTGAQISLRLLRQCFSSKPFTSEEVAQLQIVHDVAAHLLPALPLAAQELDESAFRLAELHKGMGGGSHNGRLQRGHPDLKTSYMQFANKVVGGFQRDSRCLLTHSEEWQSMGRVRNVVGLPQPMRLGCVIFTNVPLCQAPNLEGYVEESEKALLSLMEEQPSPESTAEAYPLSGSDENNGEMLDLEKTVHGELLRSWQAHARSVNRPSLKEGASEIINQWQIDQDIQQVEGIQGCVKSRRATVELYVLENITFVPDDLAPHASSPYDRAVRTSFQLLRTAGLLARARQQDLLRIALDKRLLKECNPFLSEASCDSLHTAIIHWLELCVLEDRLARLTRLSASPLENFPELIQELQTRRTWDAREHVKWLVLEAEGQLQIRPTQYQVARCLMDDPGAVCQLNMGEGKTRVILPMLALHWADGKVLVRLNFLTSMFDEAYNHLHNCLCASAIGMRLFVLPFNRDVNLTPDIARMIRASLQHAAEVKGALLTSPEWRMSLKLKYIECHGPGNASDGVKPLREALKSIQDMPAQDILDESDEMLHYRWHLVYACGAASNLPELEARQAAAQALLLILSQVGVEEEGDVVEGILPDSVGVLEPPAVSDQQANAATGKLPGAYSGLRLIRGNDLTAVESDLRQWIIGRLLDKPTFDFKWMESLDDGLKDVVARCTTDPRTSVEEQLAPYRDQFDSFQYKQVLALRGLVARGVLFAALMKRNRVQYGVNRGPAAKKRLAIPFRAAQTPAERSEFVQPDITLVLTHLAYYCDGLAFHQVLQALKVLVGMGPAAQDAQYQEWLNLQPQMVTSLSRRSVIDSAAKIDVTNKDQVQRLHRTFRHNMALINFFLRFCVLHDESQVFPSRMACTPWQLSHAVEKRVVGFSGTKDNHFLLPAHVHQASPEDIRLLATDGKMLSLLLGNDEHTPCYYPLNPTEERPLWQVVLDTAIDQSLDAVLDCGALLAGTSTREAASYARAKLTQKQTTRFKGVCWYDVQEAWTIRDWEGRTWPLNTSPLMARDCFVIFDEAHCRGADLQLSRGAVGLLTLAPKSTKDKVMQAAGRLRQLMHGQQFVHFAGSTEVTVRISGGAPGGEGPISATDILRWVMGNTVQATLDGILPWAVQGIHYAATMDAPERFFEPEHLRLEELYDAAVHSAPVGEVVDNIIARLQTEVGDNLSDAARCHLNEIQQHSRTYGAGHEVLSSGTMLASSLCDVVGDAAAVHILAEEASEARALPSGIKKNQRQESRKGQGGGQLMNADEECERELEREQEKEEEKEVELLPVKARHEAVWDFAAAIKCKSLEELAAVIGELSSLRSAARTVAAGGHTLARLPWSEDIWCTQNFLYATHAGRPLNNHMRPLDAMLRLPDKQLVLLSEHETDGILQALYDADVRQASGLSPVSRAEDWAPRPYLVHLSYLGQAWEKGLSSVPLARAADSHNAAWRTRASTSSGAAAQTLAREALLAHQVVSLKLFNGETRYRTAEQKKRLREFVEAGREMVVELVAMRGKLPHLSRSCLDDACKGFALSKRKL